VNPKCRTSLVEVRQSFCEWNCYVDTPAECDLTRSLWWGYDAMYKE